MFEKFSIWLCSLFFLCYWNVDVRNHNKLTNEIADYIKELPEFQTTGWDTIPMTPKAVSAFVRKKFTRETFN